LASKRLISIHYSAIRQFKTLLSFLASKPTLSRIYISTITNIFLFGISAENKTLLKLPYAGRISPKDVGLSLHASDMRPAFFLPLTFSIETVIFHDKLAKK
jgi:hypothetical protein